MGQSLPCPKLHPGPCSSVGVRPRTDRHTDTQTIHFASSTTHAKCNNCHVMSLYIRWQWCSLFIPYLCRLYSRHDVRQARTNVCYCDITFYSYKNYTGQVFLSVERLHRSTMQLVWIGPVWILAIELVWS